MLITVSLICNFSYDVIQIRCSVDVLKDYFEAPLLFQFVCMEFDILAFKFFCYIGLNNGAFGLNVNLLIICNFYLMIANGDFL